VNRATTRNRRIIDPRPFGGTARVRRTRHTFILSSKAKDIEDVLTGTASLPSDSPSQLSDPRKKNLAKQSRRAAPAVNYSVEAVAGATGSRATRDDEHREPNPEHPAPNGR
jgi:hypothetical protein